MHTIREFAQAHAETLAAFGIISGVLFLISLLAVPWLIARLPADYFVRERPQLQEDGWRWYRWLAGKVFKNLLGTMLFLAGAVMLGLPGQGLLTMLIGLTLIDYPGKRQLELRIMRRPRILRAINWMRRRYGQPPLMVEAEPDEVVVPTPAITARTDTAPRDLNKLIQN
ncbi:MAG: hypothetical protein ACK5Q5_08055 [Planctomycetaceae bacterium]